MSYPSQPMPGYSYPPIMGQPMMPMMQPPIPGMTVPSLPGQSVMPAIHYPPSSAPPPTTTASEQFAPVHVPASTASMKVATTVFVGNISDKATDTLVRQMLLRCGSVVGWKRVQDASGKLQAFGFCEYAEPESTLRALRLLHDKKLGDKSLVVKVDAKTRKDLLKYVTKRKREKNNEDTYEATLDRIVSEIESSTADNGLSALTEVVGDDMKKEDETITEGINTLLKQHLEILTSDKSNEDMQREHDVKESILFMAKQCGNIDPESTLEDMEMEEGIKTLVSDEIKRFRQAYKPNESRIMERKKLDERDSSPGRSRARERSRSPRPRSRSPRRRSRSPLRSRSKERAEREKEREKRRQKQKEESAKDEEDFEERQRQRKIKVRERAYKDRLTSWENRERRKAKDYDKDLASEESKRNEMVREKKHLADFLKNYDDGKDDNKYYRGSALSRRRREREDELDEDKKDRVREKKEIEALRLEAIERQARRRLKDYSSASEESDDDDEQLSSLPTVSEDIPLTKTEPATASIYPPIQVQPAPVVQTPPSKESGGMISVPFKEEIMKGDDPSQTTSPQVSKFIIGLKKSAPSSNSSPTIAQKPKLETIFSTEADEEVEEKPKKKIVPIEYSDDEDNVNNGEIYSKKISPEERKKMIQNLVNSIPSSKNDVFAFELKWDQMDSNLIEKRVKPWINKKMTEYIGETEPILTDFICNKLACHVSPSDVLTDISQVFDEDAETFVVKLWRVLIFETEAKHLGIAKSY